MSLNAEIINTYFTLKNKLDAAYLVFRRQPSLESAAKHTNAMQEFRSYCINTMADLVGDKSDTSAENNKILENFEDYEVCKQCRTKVVFRTAEDQFIKSKDFLADFPGWCYNCLVEHCYQTDCQACTVAADPSKCSFKEVKNTYTTNQSTLLYPKT